MLKSKRSLETWTFLSPPKLIRTPITYKGSSDRVISNELEDDEDRYLRRARYSNMNPSVFSFLFILIRTSLGAESRNPQLYKETKSCFKCERDFVIAYLTYFQGHPLCTDCRPYYEFGSDISLPLFAEDTLAILESTSRSQRLRM